MSPWERSPVAATAPLLSWAARARPREPRSARTPCCARIALSFPMTDRSTESCFGDEAAWAGAGVVEPSVVRPTASAAARLWRMVHCSLRRLGEGGIWATRAEERGTLANYGSASMRTLLLGEALVDLICERPVSGMTDAD